MHGVVAALLLAQASDISPKDALERVAASYGKLGSFSMHIEHSDSSGLFPGPFEQQLEWRRESGTLIVQGEAKQKANRFRLTVTRRNSSKAPDYFCNGLGIMSSWTDGRREYRVPFEDPNTMPGWEVSGGLILGWLQETPNSKFLIDPPDEMELNYSFGNSATWKGEKVKELILDWKSGDTTRRIWLYMSPKFDRYVGFEWEPKPGKPHGFAHYSMQRRNPRLPKNLGEYPKA